MEEGRDRPDPARRRPTHLSPGTELKPGPGQDPGADPEQETKLEPGPDPIQNQIKNQN